MFDLQPTLENDTPPPEEGGEEVAGVLNATPGDGAVLRAPKRVILADLMGVDSATVGSGTTSAEHGHLAEAVRGVDDSNATIVSLIDALRAQLAALRGAFVPGVKGTHLVLRHAGLAKR